MLSGNVLPFTTLLLIARHVHHSAFFPLPYSRLTLLSCARRCFLNHPGLSAWAPPLRLPYFIRGHQPSRTHSSAVSVSLPLARLSPWQSVPQAHSLPSSLHVDSRQATGKPNLFPLYPQMPWILPHAFTLTYL